MPQRTVSYLLKLLWKNRILLIVVFIFALSGTMLLKFNPLKDRLLKAYVANRELEIVSAHEAQNNGVGEHDNSGEVLIYLDAGHGGIDGGTYYKNIQEKDLNLDITLKLGKLLEDDGIKVVYARKEDIYSELIDRINEANELKVTFYISIHNNAMPGDPNYGGTETLYCPPQRSVPGQMDGERLATIIQRQLVKKLETVNRGIISRPDLGVVRLTKMPAVIAEIGYLSNSRDRENLLKESFRQKAAEALYDALKQALEEMGAVRDDKGIWMLPKNSH